MVNKFQKVVSSYLLASEQKVDKLNETVPLCFKVTIYSHAK